MPFCHIFAVSSVFGSDLVYCVLEKIMQLQVFKPGDEPHIAAAVLDLFSLLPQASQFVESLVKQTVRLEMALHRYKPCLPASPFREPLAKYLNRHYASKFFLSMYFLSVGIETSVDKRKLSTSRCCRFLFARAPHLQSGVQ